MKAHPHQQSAIDFYNQQPTKGILIYHEMGLGKTFTALNILNQTPDKYALIIMPKSAVQVWRTERNKFTPNLTKTTILIPYSQLHKAKGQIRHHLPLINTVVLDESHFIKNPTTKRVMSLAGLIDDLPKTVRFLLLTGTPDTNGAYEFYTSWCLCKASNNQEVVAHLLDSKLYHRFQKSFSNPHKQHIKYKDRTGQTRVKVKTVYKGTKNTPELTKLLQNFTHHKTLADAETLPLKLENKISLNIDDDQMLKDADIKKPNHYMSFNERLSRAKIPYAIQWIKDFQTTQPEKKLVVFGTHRQPLIELSLKFSKNAVLLLGDTPAKERVNVIAQFTNEPSVTLFLTSFQAGGTALNLQHAHTALYIGYPWTHAALAQAQARIHRQGQTEHTNHYFILSGENDQRILNLIQTKEESSQTIVDHLDGNITLESFI